MRCAPGIPCALYFFGRVTWQDSGDSAPRECGVISFRRHAPPPGLAFGEPDDRLRRGIQYAAAYRFNHWRLWNTGSPGPVYAKASTGLSVLGSPKLLAKATSRAKTREWLFEINQPVVPDKRAPRARSGTHNHRYRLLRQAGATASASRAWWLWVPDHACRNMVGTALRAFAHPTSSLG